MALSHQSASLHLVIRTVTSEPTSKRCLSGCYPRFAGRHLERHSEPPWVFASFGVRELEDCRFRGSPVVPSGADCVVRLPRFALLLGPVLSLRLG